MKILFDASTPYPLAKFLRGHDIVRAGKTGWNRLENGDLIKAAEAEGFDLVLTCDQNLQYQQNLSSRKIAIVILTTNDWPTIRRVAHRVANMIDFAQRGQFLCIDINEI